MNGPRVFKMKREEGRAAQTRKKPLGWVGREKKKRREGREERSVPRELVLGERRRSVEVRVGQNKWGPGHKNRGVETDRGEGEGLPLQGRHSTQSGGGSHTRGRDEKTRETIERRSGAARSPKKGWGENA